MCEAASENDSRCEMKRKKQPGDHEYSFCIDAGITLHTDVYAASTEDAVKEAIGRPVMTLCSYCASGKPEREWVTSGEIDCDPSQCDLLEATRDGVDITEEAKKIWLE